MGSLLGGEPDWTPTTGRMVVFTLAAPGISRGALTNTDASVPPTETLL